MNIYTAQNAHTLIHKLNRVEDKINSIDKIKKEAKAIKKSMMGEVAIHSVGFSAQIRLEPDEIFEMLDFLSAYWTMEKHKAMKDIEKL